MRDESVIAHVPGIVMGYWGGGVGTENGLAKRKNKDKMDNLTICHHHHHQQQQSSRV